eukprot:1147463-Pelagomonas_calceolata.AAC.5
MPTPNGRDNKGFSECAKHHLAVKPHKQNERPFGTYACLSILNIILTITFAISAQQANILTDCFLVQPGNVAWALRAGFLLCIKDAAYCKDTAYC